MVTWLRGSSIHARESYQNIWEMTIDVMLGTDEERHEFCVRHWEYSLTHYGAITGQRMRDKTFKAISEERRKRGGL